MGLLDKMRKSGSLNGFTLKESAVKLATTITKTSYPFINIAFRGSVNGGIESGMTTIAGESKSFKTILSWLLAKEYLDAYPDAIVIFYDCEFGAKNAIKQLEIDEDRVLHVPFTTVENMTKDLKQKLEDIDRKDKVLILVDSIGNAASDKEVQDTIDGKDKADMTRAKALKKFGRIITPDLNMKDIPLILINHTYKTQELYSKDVVSGGTGIMYSSDQVFIITKAQEKDAKNNVIGWEFTIRIEKSRSVQEKAKIKFKTFYDTFIDRYSGLMDIALNHGVVIKPSNGWYSRVDMDTGEVEEKRWRFADTNSIEFWGEILKHPKFDEFVRKDYELGSESREQALLYDNDTADLDETE